MRPCILVLSLTAALSARAQTDPQQGEAKERAKRLLQEGLEFEAKGDPASALRRFEQAYAAFPSPKILFNRASARQELGRAPDAAADYTRFLQETEGAADIGADRRRAAEEALKELRRQLAVLEIELEPKEASLALDGQPITRPLSGIVYVWPGDHVLSASVPGYETRSLRLEMHAGDTKQAKLTLQIAPLAQTAPMSSPAPVLDRTAETGRSKRLWGIGLAAGGAAVGALGLYFALDAKSKGEDLNRCLSSPCSRSEIDATLDGGSRSDTLAELFGIAGGAAVVTGVILYLLGRHGRPSVEPGSVSVLPLHTGALITCDAPF